MQLQAAEGSEVGRESTDPGRKRAEAVAAARAGLRARVVALTRAAAAAGPETNEVECGKVGFLFLVCEAHAHLKSCHHTVVAPLTLPNLP